MAIAVRLAEHCPEMSAKLDTMRQDLKAMQDAAASRACGVVPEAAQDLVAERPIATGEVAACVSGHDMTMKTAASDEGTPI